MYSVFVLEEMRVEYSIRRVINRREYPSRDIRRALDTLIRKQEGEAEEERKLYLCSSLCFSLSLSSLPTKIEEMKVLAV